MNIYLFPRLVINILHKRCITFIILVLVAPLVLAWTIAGQLPAHAMPPFEGKQAMLFYFENDTFNDTDRHYTNAFRCTWVSSEMLDSELDETLWNTPASDLLKQQYREPAIRTHNIILSFGQNMYTPSNIAEESLQENDRPYAGLIYGALGVQSKDFHRLDLMELSLGLVGPSSRAGQTQRAVHCAVDQDTPQGWDHQLKDEVGFVLTLHRSYRYDSENLGSGVGLDLIPHHAVDIGTFRTGLSVGGEARLGFNLPADFGTSLIRPGASAGVPSKEYRAQYGGPAEWGVYLFFGVEGALIARDITLDGNTFRDSHSVDKEHARASLSAGLAVIYKGARVSYSHVYNTPTSTTQDEGQYFGSVTIGLAL